jgi:ATP-binding cassette subfamily B protein
MRFPIRKFLSYYKPYWPLFTAVLVCSFVVSAVTVAFPLLVRYITKDVLAGDMSEALGEVYRIGGLMLALAVVQNVGNCFVDYKGHEVGARIESDLRSELFAHMQSLSFSFYDKQKKVRIHRCLPAAAYTRICMPGSSNSYESTSKPLPQTATV